MTGTGRMEALDEGQGANGRAQVVTNFAHISNICGSLRRQKYRFLYDFLAVATGIKPAVMIDYTPIPPHHFCAILRQIYETLPPGTPGGISRGTPPGMPGGTLTGLSAVRLVQLGGCFCLMRVDSMLTHLKKVLEGPSGTCVRFVSLAGPEPMWVSSKEYQSICSQLEKFASVLSATCQAHVTPPSTLLSSSASYEEGEGEWQVKKSRKLRKPMMTSASSPTASSCASSFTSTSPSYFFTDLDPLIIEIDLPLPTINGCLLGYPVIYVFPKSQGVEVAQRLSLQSLHLFRCQVPCTLFDNKSRSEDCDNTTLSSFTIPANLSPNGVKETWLQEWVTNLNVLLAANNSIWRPCGVSLSVPPLQSIAL